MLRRNILTSLKQDFIAHLVTSTYRNLTAQQFTRFFCVFAPLEAISAFSFTLNGVYVIYDLPLGAQDSVTHV